MLRKWLKTKVQKVMASRPPDQLIGRPGVGTYLERWYLFRSRRFPIFNLFIHRFLRSDDDKALHDHPWWSVSWLFDGEYVEYRADGSVCHYSADAFILRSATFSHRIELIDNKPACTLFLTGFRVRQWGFWCPAGWTHWKDFVRQVDNGQGELVDVGCGEA